MTKLTEADKVEIRVIYGNNPGMSYEDVANTYKEGTGRKLHRSTVMRIIKERDPTAGDTLPSKRRGRMGTHGATPNDFVAQHTPLAVVQEPPRTEALQSGANKQAQAIMKELQALLSQEATRLQELDRAEAELKDRTAGLPVQDKYKLLSGIHKDWEKNREGMRQTLSDMAYLSKTLVMYFDNRQVHIHFDRDGLLSLLLNEVIYPVLQEELPRAVGQALTEKMQAKYLARLNVFENYGKEEL
jgi:hypothetical protein